MANAKEVKVPDVGGDEVEVIEVLVSEGDSIEAEGALITVESDKASMDIPAPFGGTIESLKVKEGDKIKEGDLLAMIAEAGDDESSDDSSDDDSDENADDESRDDRDDAEDDSDEDDEESEDDDSEDADDSDNEDGSDDDEDGDSDDDEEDDSDDDEEGGSSEIIDVEVPDIGEDGEVEVIEILVSEGDSVEAEDGLITLETDKATMDVPCPQAGTVKEIVVKEGDKVKQGSMVIKLEVKGSGSSSSSGKSSSKDSGKDSGKGSSKGSSKDTGKDSGKGSSKGSSKDTGKGSASDDTSDKKSSSKDKSADRAASTSSKNKGDSAKGSKETNSSRSRKPPVPDHPLARKGQSEGIVHASPSVRRVAREFGVDLSKVQGSGPKERILKEDVQQFVKYELSRPKASSAPATGGEGGLQVIAQPKVDFEKFGEVEKVQMTRIQRISGPNLHRNWVTIPHVTQFDEADITELEAFRKSENELQAKLKTGMKFTPLVFIMKACAQALREFPVFNSSLHEDGEHIIMKKYVNIGIAVDTPNGLVVPVIRDVDKKGIKQLSEELNEISSKARDGKLKSTDLQGGCFSISSLGGIGGTAFTPIVNAPDVAILGVSKNEMKPVWNGSEFVPRLKLPLSLSYDHRVIDGAVAARFTTYLNHTLSDIRKLLL